MLESKNHCQFYQKFSKDNVLRNLTPLFKGASLLVVSLLALSPRISLANLQSSDATAPQTKALKTQDAQSQDAKTQTINDKYHKGSELVLHELISEQPRSWAIEVTSNDELFITHRNGHVSVFDIKGKQNNKLYSFDLPLSDLYNKGQGGLLDIAFSPDHKNDAWLYFSYSYGTDDANGLKVIRVKLEQDKVIDLQKVFTQRSLRDTPVHFGGRIGFLDEFHLLVTLGDGFDYRENAQLEDSELGKIIKVSLKGLSFDNVSGNKNIAASNASSIYSRGHRNPQGLIILEDGTVIGHEHGPDGGDEINIIKEGANYGWPVITNGKDYIGGMITPFKEYEGMEMPDYDWTPSIAPSGMVLYKHDKFPSLKNRLLVTSLKYKQVHTVEYTPLHLSNEKVLFTENQHRLRDIAQSSAGDIFLLTDGDGAKVLKVAQ